MSNHQMVRDASIFSVLRSKHVAVDPIWQFSFDINIVEDVAIGYALHISNKGLAIQIMEMEQALQLDTDSFFKTLLPERA